MKPLRSIGIVGWDHVEVPLLSALLAGVPPLLVGSYGEAKTDGSKAIAQALLGPSLRWSVYECPNVDTDHIIGIIKVSSLSEDKAEYVDTGHSVWNLDALCLDEINRAHRTVRHKLLELVRTKTVYGKPTPLRFVFATANPPTPEYQVERMDMATVSRFAVVKVPDFASFDQDDMRRVLAANLSQAGTFDWWRVAEQEYKSGLDQSTLTLKCVQLLLSKGIQIHGRTARMLNHMVRAAFALQSCGAVEITPEDMSSVIRSCLPECSGVAVRTLSDDVIQSIDTALTVFWSGELRTAKVTPKNWPEYITFITSTAENAQTKEDFAVVRDHVLEVAGLVDSHSADVHRYLDSVVRAKLAHATAAGVTYAYSLPELLSLCLNLH